MEKAQIEPAVTVKIVSKIIHIKMILLIHQIAKIIHKAMTLKEKIFTKLGDNSREKYYSKFHKETY